MDKKECSLDFLFCKSKGIHPDPISVICKATDKISIVKVALSQRAPLSTDKFVLVIKGKFCEDDDELSLHVKPGQSEDVYVIIRSESFDFSSPIIPQLPDGVSKIISKHCGKKLVETTKILKPKKKPNKENEVKVSPPPKQQPRQPAQTKQQRVPTVEIVGWDCKVCSVTNLDERLFCSVCGADRPEDYVPKNRNKKPVEPKKKMWECKECTSENDLNKEFCSVCQAERPDNDDDKNVANVWDCPECTFENSAVRLFCGMCACDRPEDFQAPNLDVLSEEDRQFYEKMEKSMKEFQEEENKLIVEFTKELQETDNDLLTNNEEFECQICLEVVAPGEGAILHSCTHEFCRGCLIGHIKEDNKFPCRCPSNTGGEKEGECAGVLEHREIKALLSPDEWETFLKKESSAAESSIPNSFHCRTANCAGWIIVGDNVDKYQCPVCQIVNCITCRAQHDPMNCKDYQDDLVRRAKADENARKDLELFERMLANKEAMKCPQCTVLLMKLTGCDWIQCTMCKLEICWVTQKPRRGENGCKCEVQKCHPNCRNCH